MFKPLNKKYVQGKDILRRHCTHGDSVLSLIVLMNIDYSNHYLVLQSSTVRYLAYKFWNLPNSILQVYKSKSKKYFL